MHVYDYLTTCDCTLQSPAATSSNQRSTVAVSVESTSEIMKSLKSENKEIAECIGAAEHHYPAGAQKDAGIHFYCKRQYNPFEHKVYMN